MLDWLELITRWLHVIAGIAWIGSSFYFIFLDASLRRRNGEEEEGVAGESWQVHGGGFYRMRKYSVAPEAMPEELHWFKYEAYTTWLTGIFLLGLIYYLNAGVYLVDRSAMDLTETIAIAVSAGSLIAGWLVYHILCRSPLGRNDAALAGVGFVLLVAAAWGYSEIFPGRAAYVHMGALIGTMMAANVFFVIIPNQKVAVAELIAGRAPDAALGKAAKQRSVHNNYLTLPVVFLMISGHYPMTYSGPRSWAVVAGIIITGAVVRHFFNLKHAGRGAKYGLLAVAAVVLAGTAALTRRPAPSIDPDAAAPDIAAVEGIIATRCRSCHSAAPTFAGVAAAPMGLVLDTAEDIAREADRIFAQTIETDAMPLGNVTGMTAEERALLAAWYSARGEAE